ncbi:MAG: acetolactate synthase large subunit, partial [Lachnospiraceae bacterium]|nr:acetolactate synthase large subunit [Lachnospiraceae bacterium]
FGAEGYKVTTPEEFDKALNEALEVKKGPVVIDCVIDQDDKVWPMVAPGAPISESFTDEDLKKGR